MNEILNTKHPKAEPCHDDVLLPKNAEVVETVIFEEIDGELVKRAAKRTYGSGVPTKIDADTWKHLLCSKYYGALSDTLASDIANFAKKLCTKRVAHEKIETYVACRLLPLQKDDNGVRPIGIGEAIRRIVGKCIS